MNEPVATKAAEDANVSPVGNQRLTAMTGVALLILFTAEVITTLLLGSLFSIHFFLGMLLIGPVCLKVGSTVWRFLRYYTGSEPYVRKGHPQMLHRVLGPLLILATAGVLGTGVILAVTGPDLTWQKLHQRPFYLWLLIVIVHVVHYVPRLPQLLAGNPADRLMQAASGSRARWLLLAGSLIFGLILAMLTYHLRGAVGQLGWQHPVTTHPEGSTTRARGRPGSGTALRASVRAPTRGCLKARPSRRGHGRGGRHCRQPPARLVYFSGLTPSTGPLAVSTPMGHERRSRDPRQYPFGFLALERYRRC